MSQINRELAATLLAFMDRVPVTGQEALVWAQCHHALMQIVNPPAPAESKAEGEPLPEAAAKRLRANAGKAE